MLEVRRYTHPKPNRIGGVGSFKPILDQKIRVWRGPIGMAVAPRENTTPARRSRLGISIGRPVGTAVVRNRIKRLLREAFRLMQHDWPRPFDVVILVKRHEPLTLAEYQKLLSGLMVECVRKSNNPR